MNLRYVVFLQLEESVLAWFSGLKPLKYGGVETLKQPPEFLEQDSKAILASKSISWSLEYAMSLYIDDLDQTCRCKTGCWSVTEPA